MPKEPREIEIGGRRVLIDDFQGHLMVAHDGDIEWDELFAIKGAIWGEEARAIEVYPAKSNLVDSGNFRHLWRLGLSDFAPDLLGCDGHEDSLKSRTTVAWAESRQITTGTAS